MDFARAGFEATELVTLPEGPLPQFSHAIEPHLRQLGLPTALKNGAPFTFAWYSFATGVINLEREFIVCKVGDSLTPEQAKILVRWTCVWLGVSRVRRNCSTCPCRSSR